MFKYFKNNIFYFEFFIVVEETFKVNYQKFTRLKKVFTDLVYN